MRENTLRAIGASVLLLAVAFAAFIQMDSRESDAVEISAPETTEATQTTVRDVAVAEPSTTEGPPAPFEYRIGLLSGVSTDNYWQYIGESPTVWNAYVLGPTKPALYAVEPITSSLTLELATEMVEPTQEGDSWVVEVDLNEMTWSDETPVTASDIQFTFETVRALQLGGGWASAYPESLTKIAAVDPITVRYEFNARPPLAVWPHAVGLAPVMPAHIWADTATSNDDLYAATGVEDVSGGPLTITSISDTRIEAYLSSDPSVSVVYNIFGDESQAVDDLAAGDIDTIVSPKGLSETSINQLSEIEEVTIAKSPANSVRYLGFNFTREPMKQQQFRDALGLLLSRETIVDKLTPDGTAAYTMLPDANQAWFSQTAADAIASDYAGDLTKRMESAVAGLTSAGYTWEKQPNVDGATLVAGTGLKINGVEPAPLTILTPGDEYDPSRPEYAAEIESVVEVLGFDVRPIVTDFDSVVDLAFNPGEDGQHHYDMYLLGWTLGNPAFPDYYRPLFTDNSPANSSGYSSKRFNQALTQFEAATTTDEAASALWDMETLLASHKPYLVLSHPSIAEAYRSDRVGFEWSGVLGGTQGRLGGLEDVTPIR